MKKCIFIIVAFLGLTFVGCESESNDSIQNASGIGSQKSDVEDPDFLKGPRVLNVIYKNYEDPADPLNGVVSFVVCFGDLSPAFGVESEGYYYSESSGCFIYGTWVTWPSGIRIFERADISTQYIFNRCGYKNVG